MADIFDEIQFSDKDYTDIVMKNPQAKWFQRAFTNPASITTTKGKKRSVYSMTGTINIEGKDRHVVLPTVRLDRKTGSLYELTENEAWDEAKKNKDFIFADSAGEAEFISKGFSGWQGRRND